MKLKLFYVAFLILISIITGCKKSSNPVDNLPILPTLNDSIPYKSLGQGKIVFERIGPLSNNYDGGYVIDINNHKSWGVLNGVFDGPSISPNGKYISFSTSTPYPAKTYFDIYTINIDGSNFVQMTSLTDQDNCPSWSSDGDIYFQSGYFNLYKTSFPSHYTAPVFTLGFTAVFMRSRTSHALDGRIIFSVTNKILVWQGNLNTLKSNSIKGIEYWSPAYNPQGDKIAYIEATHDTLNWNYTKIKVIKMNSDGNNSIILAELNMNARANWSGSNNISLCWSPDGTKIAFNKPEYDYCSHIYVINSDGTNLIQVTKAEGVTDRSVSWGN